MILAVFVVTVQNLGAFIRLKLSKVLGRLLSLSIPTTLTTAAHHLGLIPVTKSQIQ